MTFFMNSKFLCLNNYSSSHSVLYEIFSYVFGISLYEFDISTRNLKYRFFVPETEGDEWKLSNENAWEDPFGVTLNRQESVISCLLPNKRYPLNAFCVQA